MENTAPQQIKRWLESSGRKSGWVARQCNVNPATFSQWLCGRRVPIAAHRLKLAEITGLNISGKDVWK